MEKNYLEQLKSLRGEILGCISYLIPKGTSLKLKDPHYVTYLFGDCSVTYTCTEIRMDKEGAMVFEVVDYDGKPAESLNEEAQYQIDVASLYYLLNEVEKEVRENMVDEIIEIAKSFGGKLTFFGEHPFQVEHPFKIEEQESVFCNLTAIYLGYNSEPIIKNTFEGDTYHNSFDEVSIADLNLLLTYARECCKKEYSIYVHGSYGRVINVEASSLDEAYELAKEEWKRNPLNIADSNGEDWQEWK